MMLTYNDKTGYRKNLKDLFGANISGPYSVERRGLPYVLKDLLLERYQVNGFSFTVLVLASDNALLLIKNLSKLVALKPLLPLVFVVEGLTRRDIRLLIRNSVAFISGENMFLPFMGLSLQKTLPVKPKPRLSLTAQIALLHHIFVDDLTGKVYKDIAQCTGYSLMSVSRIARELVQLDIASVSGSKEKKLVIVKPPYEVAQFLMEFGATPVVSRIGIDDISDLESLTPAGESALSKLTLIGEPEQPVFAMDKLSFYDMNIDEARIISPDWSNYVVELWKYPPHRFATGGIVDKISLYLSLKNHEDERIQIALETIKGELKLGLRTGDSGLGKN